MCEERSDELKRRVHWISTYILPNVTLLLPNSSPFLTSPTPLRCSFGILILEVAAHGNLMSAIKKIGWVDKKGKLQTSKGCSGSVFARRMAAGKRPDFNNSSPSVGSFFWEAYEDEDREANETVLKLKDLTISCLASESEDRPTFHEIAEQLRDMKDSLPLSTNFQTLVGESVQRAKNRVLRARAIG